MVGEIDSAPWDADGLLCIVREVTNTRGCSYPAKKKTWSRVGARYLGAIFGVEGAALMASGSAPAYPVKRCVSIHWADGVGC